MKKSDIAMIVLIASVGMLIAYFIATSISFLHVPENGIKVQTMPKISADVAEPSKDVFNENAINPTVEVIVGSDGASSQ